MIFHQFIRRSVCAMTLASSGALVGWPSASALAQDADADTIPGTSRWEGRGDSQAAASAMVEGLHVYLDNRLATSVERRKRHWDRDLSSAEAYEQSVEPNRRRLERILGAVDSRAERVVMRLVGATDQPSLIAESRSFRVFAVRWDVYEDVQAEGLLLEPKGDAKANIVALADCDVTPEQYVGLTDGQEPVSQVARLLAEAGCRVVVPTLLDRSTTYSGHPEVTQTNLTHREWIWRQAFEAGRHPIGYEVDAVRAAVDWFTRDGAPDRPLGVVGHGEGGLIALYAAALDTRIDAAWVGGAFGTLGDVWNQPVYRDVWGLLDEFGDAEVASLIFPRSLLIARSDGPKVEGPPPPVNGRSLAASGRLTTPDPKAVQEENERLLTMTKGLPHQPVDFVAGEGQHNFSDTPRRLFLRDVLKLSGFKKKSEVREPLGALGIRNGPVTTWTTIHELPDAKARQGRWIRALQEHTQALIRVSELRRSEYWSDTDRSSPGAWDDSTPPYREVFREEVIGSLPEPSEPLEARSIQVLDTPNFKGYAVELPVWPEVVASGVLLLPKDLKPGEERPVVICQHGLEGTPDPIVTPGVDSPYNSYGAALADRGYIVYAPQNPYIGVDRFRTLQRKAHPLEASLFSIIVRQHERTLEWLKTLSNVDPERIALYGLSYGGKTAMRVPALLEDYCLSICSADFNEWVVKCTNLTRRYSYMYTIEYDMYEWDLAHRANYAEMAGLIAPRPFMVERGHDDGVAPDEWVAYEFAKVRRLYDRLGIGDRAALTVFNGGHEIEGRATFEFLSRHLDWPRGAAPLNAGEAE